jgi:TIR domain
MSNPSNKSEHPTDQATGLFPPAAFLSEARSPHQQTAGYPQRARDLVFISYSHADKKWLDLLQTSLLQYKSETSPCFWADTKIRGGDKWEKELMSALDEASAAILLVSRNYLASEYICEKELPIILNAQEQRGLTVLWIAVEPCAWKETKLQENQGLNNPKRPWTLLSQGRLGEELQEISSRIVEIVKSKRGPLPAEREPIILPGVEPTPPPRYPIYMVEKPTQELDPAERIVRARNTSLLIGYLYVEQHGEEIFLVRGDRRLPFIEFAERQAPHVDANELINICLRKFCDKVGIKTGDLVAAKNSAPSVYNLHQVTGPSSTVEQGPWYFFKLRLNRQIKGTKAAWEKEKYSWVLQGDAEERWHLPDIMYGEGGDDPHFERSHPLPACLDNPYEIIARRRISLEVEHKVADSIDMLVFRCDQRHAIDQKHTIEFLLVQRADNNRWENLYWDIAYHEAPLEGTSREESARRKISQAVGIEKSALHFCGELGLPVLDVPESGAAYTTLRVRGLTFYCSGKLPKIVLGQASAYRESRWVPLDQAQELLEQRPSAVEFLRRWKEQQQAIIERAHQIRAYNL